MPSRGFYATYHLLWESETTIENRRLMDDGFIFVTYKTDSAKQWVLIIYVLGGGFKYALFSPLLGEDFQFD